MATSSPWSSQTPWQALSGISHSILTQVTAFPGATISNPCCTCWFTWPRASTFHGTLTCSLRLKFRKLNLFSKAVPNCRVFLGRCFHCLSIRGTSSSLRSPTTIDIWQRSMVSQRDWESSWMMWFGTGHCWARLFASIPKFMKTCLLIISSCQTTPKKRSCSSMRWVTS